MVLISPSLMFVEGDQSSFSLAREISGSRWVGSSEGSSLKIILDFELVSSIISLAKSRIVRSSGLPRLTGPVKLLSISLTRASVMSST